MKHNYQIEINDLIDDAIGNAVARRELAAIPNDEATNIVGGLAALEKKVDLIIAGMKPVVPPCPPPNPPVYCPPPKPPVKPICPPILVGLMYYPIDKIEV